MSTIQKPSKETEDDSQGQKTDSAENRSYNTDGVESKLLQSTAKSGKWVRMQSVRPVHTHFLEINLGQKRALLGEESDSELLTKRVGFQRGVVENYLIWWRLVPSPTNNHEYPMLELL